MRYLRLAAILATASITIPGAIAQDELPRIINPKAAKPKALDKLVINEKLFDTEIENVLEAGKNLGFEWMSRQKTSIRSAYPKFTLFEIPVGEVVMRSEEGSVSDLTISLFNRGDDGDMAAASFNERFDKFERALTKALGEKPRKKNRDGVTEVRGLLWVTDTQAFLLESSVNKDGDPEFMRLLAKSPKDSRSGSKMKNRSALRRNVIKKDNGDVYVEGVPMVDQGQKGYCAVASAQRIFNYYGNGIDMHELAQAAETGPDSGTSLPEMIASLKKAMSLVRSRVLITYTKYDGIDSEERDWDDYERFLKDFSRDWKKYNRECKKQGFTDKMVPMRESNGIDLPSGSITLEDINLDIYRQINMEKNEYRTFMSKIKQYVDQGIPVAWALELGMFKEEGLPQTGGGHMRLIIGYNEKTDEIIYSDSWGQGHDYKKMPSGNAFCMTTATMTFVPNK